MSFKVEKKENIFFALKVIFSLLVLFWVIQAIKMISGLGTEAITTSVTIFLIYGIFIWIFVFFQKIILIGHLKGNGIEVSQKQFSDVYYKYTKMAENLQIKKVPRLFILQQGGMLNAFATRFSGKNYIAIYSEIFSVFEENENVVQFILAHELGHVKRNHLIKRFWTFPSMVVPFLEAAYSRSCEYTCDNIGKSLVPDECIQGLILLAAGKDIYKKINIESYIENARENNTTVVKFANLFMSHPYLPRRIEKLK